MQRIILAVGALVAGSVLASAQDVKVEKKVEERPGVNVQVPVPGVNVEKRERVETTGRGPANCDKKTVEKETPAGSKSVTKERCD